MPAGIGGVAIRRIATRRSSLGLANRPLRGPPAPLGRFCVVRAIITHPSQPAPLRTLTGPHAARQGDDLTLFGLSNGAAVDAAAYVPGALDPPGRGQAATATPPPANRAQAPQGTTEAPPGADREPRDPRGPTPRQQDRRDNEAEPRKTHILRTFVPNFAKCMFCGDPPRGSEPFGGRAPPAPRGGTENRDGSESRSPRPRRPRGHRPPPENTREGRTGPGAECRAGQAPRDHQTGHARDHGAGTRP